jgi:DNA-binding NarL/FixJ family response regulator
MSRLDPGWLALAYDNRAAQVDWLGALAQRSAELLGARDGVYAYTYRIDGLAIELDAVAAREASADYWGALSRWGMQNTASIAQLYETQVMTLGGARERARALCLPMSDPSRAFRRHGVRDLLVVMGQAGNAGVILTAPWRTELADTAAERRGLELLAAELAVAFRARALRARSAQLSPRERQVALALSRGMADKAIAHGLGVSGSTVAEYTARLRNKLGCRPGEELLALCSGSSNVPARLELLARLTPAEHVVACSLVAGSSHLQIARQRGSSSRTVASQVASVFRKAGVSGRRELAARWFGASGN